MCAVIAAGPDRGGSPGPRACVSTGRAARHGEYRRLLLFVRVVVGPKAGGQSFVYLAAESWARTGAGLTVRGGHNNRAPSALAPLTTWIFGLRGRVISRATQPRSALLARCGATGRGHNPVSCNKGSPVDGAELPGGVGAGGEGRGAPRKSPASGGLRVLPPRLQCLARWRPSCGR